MAGLSHPPPHYTISCSDGSTQPCLTHASDAVQKQPWAHSLLVHTLAGIRVRGCVGRGQDHNLEPEEIFKKYGGPGLALSDSDRS